MSSLYLISCSLNTICLGVDIRCGASLIAQLVKNPPAMQETLVRFLAGEVPLEKDRLPTPVFFGFAGGSAGKESACHGGDLGSIPGLGKSLEEGMTVLPGESPWTEEPGRL